MFTLLGFFCSTSFKSNHDSPAERGEARMSLLKEYWITIKCAYNESSWAPTVVPILLFLFFLWAGMKISAGMVAGWHLCRAKNNQTVKES